MSFPIIMIPLSLAAWSVGTYAPEMAEKRIAATLT